MSISHHIDAFHLIKRLSINWHQVKAVLSSQSNISDKILRHDVMTISESLPTTDDLSGAAFSLAHLQEAYRLNVTQFAAGNITFEQRSFTNTRPLDSKNLKIKSKFVINK